MENKLTYSDFTIGQVLICIKLNHTYYSEFNTKSFAGDYIGGETDNEIIQNLFR